MAESDSGATVYDIPGGWRFVWPGYRVQVVVKRLRDDRRNDATRAEVTVYGDDPTTGGHLHQAQLLLTSTTGKRELARTLAGRADHIPWADVVEALCVQTLALHRRGEPVQTVGNLALSGGIRYRLWPLCPDGVATVIFGEGGTGKSFLATLAGVLVQTGYAAAGLRPAQANVLYLDYETSSETLNERVRAICAGLQIHDTPLLYRYSYHPLADDIEALQDIIQEHAIGFIVADSLGPACGGDPNDAEQAIRMFNALRELRVTSLLIDHIAKNIQEGFKPSPYGSVYKVNLARSVWQIKAGEALDDWHRTVALFHRKANFGPLRQALGWSMVFENDSHEQLVRLGLSELSVSDDSDLAQELPVKQRILTYLRKGRATVSTMSEELSIKETTLRGTLQRMKGNRVNKWGEEWGLLDK